MSGYRTIMLLLWFFGARMAHEVPGVFIRVVIGGFTTKAECEQYRRQAVEMLKSAGGEITPQCISKEII